ncbi:MAG: hypothetical protein IH857_00910 [Deltaproteobacteria bacterium]|nr:hypothetical protein [Deltaproteobacteria bacterium]
MRRMFWAAILLGGALAIGTMVTAQEKIPQPTPPQQGMGSMMGMGMMGRGGRMGQMGSMMPMVQGMMKMMDACAQMMGSSPSTEQGDNK